jgi:hypothetical protein
MVKNWILLGDEAFENSDYVWGRIELSRMQQENWQSIVMEQFNSAIEKSAKVREMIDNSNIIECDFDFFEKPKVTEEEVAEFMKPLEDRFKDKTVFYKVSYNREFSWVFIDFMNVNIQPEEEDPEVDEKICIDENGNPMPNTYSILFRNLAGEWTEYDCKDVRGKVDSDGQYKIILKGREYDLEGIRNPYDDTEDFFSSRELTTAIKNSNTYFAEVDQNRVIAIYTAHIKLAIYGMEFEITIDRNRIEEYYNAAKIVTNRLNAYTFAYKDRKTKHQIAIMTMIDLAVYPFLNHSDNDEQRKEIELSVCYETIKVTIKESDQELFEKSAIRISKRYNCYLECYRSRPTDEIERMTLLDICLHRMEWRHINYMNYLI